MRILYLHQHYAGPAGSGSRRSHEFARRLVRHGHAVTVVAGSHPRSGLPVPARAGGQVAIDGIDVHVLGVPYEQAMTPGRRVLSFLQFVAGSCVESTRVGPVDLVFATSTPLTIALPGLFAALWHGCPFVFEVRDLWPAAPIELGVLRNPVLVAAARQLERLAYRRAAHVIALSEGMKAGVVATGVSSDAVTVVPNVSDTATFRVPAAQGQACRAAAGALGARPWVLYAGAFGRVNDLEWALRLAEGVARLEPRVAFLFVGEGSEKGRFEAEARDRGLLGKTVFIRDSLPREELARLLSAATVLTSFFLDLPVMRTNSANKLFDAFAAGKPAVINYGGWQAELLEREGAGLVLDRRDVEAAARQLVAALADTAWLESAGAASRRLGDTVFAQDRLAVTFQAVLERAASVGRLPRRGLGRLVRQAFDAAPLLGLALLGAIGRR